MADLYYIEEGYYDQGYFTYVADAASAVSSNSSLDVTAGVIRSAAVNLAAEFTQSTIGSRTKDIDLYAFSEAAISAVVDRIRDNNIAVDVAFDIATDGRRFRDISADDYAEFTLVSLGDRSRAFEISTQAAFSFDAIVTIQAGAISAEAALTSEFAISASGLIIRPLESALDSAFTQTADVERIQQGSVSISAEATQIANGVVTRQLASALQIDSSIDAIISHIHGADLTAFSDAAVTIVANVIKSANVAVTSNATIATTPVDITRLGAASLTSSFSVLTNSRIILRITNVAVNSGGRYNIASINTSTKKWGTGSATFTYNTGIRPQTTSTLRNMVFDGTNFKIFEAGYTWTSTDGTTFTRADNNLTESIGNVNYINDQFVAFSSSTNGKIWYTTNGTTWSTSTSFATADIASFRQEVVYIGSTYYVFVAYVSNSTYRLGFKSASTLGGTWTRNELVNTTSTSTTQIRDVFWNGSQAVISYYYLLTDATPAKNAILRFNGTTQANFIVSANVSGAGIVNAVAWDGSSTYATMWNDQLRYTTNGGTNWTNTAIAGISEIYYLNSRWFVNGTAGTYSGTSPSNVALSNYGLTSLVYGASKYVALDEFNPGQVRYSSNDSSWTNDDIESCTNLPASLVYTRGDNSDLSTFGTFDTWLRPSANGLYTTVEWYGQSTILSLRFLNSTAYFYNNGVSLGSVSITANEFNHIRISRSGSTVSIYANGSRFYTGTVTWPTGPFRIIGNAYYIDEVYITEDVLTSTGSTTYTQPSSTWLNDDNTDLLLHFNTDFEDDARLNVIPSAALTSAAALNAKLTGQQYFNAALTSAVTLTAAVGVVSEITLSAFSDAAVTTIISVIKEVDSTLTVDAAITADNLRTRDLDSAIASESTLTSSIERTLQGIISTESVASQLTAVAKIGSVIIDSSVISSLVAAGDKVTNIESSMPSDFYFNVDGIKAVDGDASLSSTISQTASGQRIRFASTDLRTAAFQWADVGKIHQGNIALSSAFTTEITTSGTIDFIALVASSGTMSTVVTKTTGYASDLIATASQTTNNTRNRDFDTSLVVTAGIEVINSRTRDTEITTEAIASELVAVGKIGQGLLNMDVVASMTTAADVLKNAVADIQSSADLSLVPSKLLATAVADLEIVASLAGQGDTNITGNAALSTKVNLDITADRTRGIQSVLSTTSSLDCLPERDRDFASLVMSSGTMSITPTRIRDAVIYTEAIATEMIIGSRAVLASANLTMTATMITDGRDIDIKKNVYMVPNEIRTWTVAAENRTRIIAEETRIYKIRRY